METPALTFGIPTYRLRAIGLNTSKRALIARSPVSDSDHEDAALGTRADTHVPLVPHSNLRPNRLQEHRDLWAHAKHAVSRSTKRRRKVGAAIVTYLPKRAGGNADFENLVDSADARASLDLERVAASNVDRALAKIEIVASERSEKNLPALIRKERTASRELVRDLTAAETLSASKWRSSARQVERVRADRIELLSPPSESKRLNIEVRQAEPIKARFGPVMDVQAQSRDRRSRGQRKRKRFLRNFGGVGNADSIAECSQLQIVDRDLPARSIAQFVGAVVGDSIDEIQTRFRNPGGIESDDARQLVTEILCVGPP
jgi:hypothetical protein